METETTEAGGEAVETPDLSETIETEVVETLTNETTESLEPEVTDPWAGITADRPTVDQALRAWEAWSTREGQAQLFIEAGHSLGLGVREMLALLESGKVPAAGAVEPEAAPEDSDEDQPLTVKAYLEMQKRQEADRVAAEQRQAESAARAVIPAIVKSLGVADEDAKAVLDLADKHVPVDAAGRRDLSETALKAAIEKGHAEFMQNVEAAAKRYLQAKKEAAAKVPQAPAGGAPAAAPPPAEPANVAEAIAMARERLRNGG